MWAWMILAKGTVAYLVLRFTVQVLGVHRVRETNTLELVLLLSLGLFAGFGTLGASFSVVGVTLLYVLWLGLYLFERYALVRSRSFREGTEDDPTVLVYHGKLLEHNLYRKRLTTEQLLSKLRARDAFRLVDVELAILEPDGDLSIMRTPQSEPLTKQDMLVAGRHYGLPLPVIIDGQIMHQNLEKRNLNEKWLRDHLRAFGVEFASEVALAMVDENLELYVDKYDDSLAGHQELHPHLGKSSTTDAKQKQLAEAPLSQPEQIYAEQQLNKTLRESLPEIPKRK